MSGAPDDPRPAPPWGAEVDLGVFQNVELPHRLVHGPEFADLALAERWVLVRLIFAAWHEVPAGSLPAHPRALADAAGFGTDLAAWQAVECACLASWTQCSDDRLYFEPMAGVIEAAFARRRKVSGTAKLRTARKRMKAELGAAGVPDVARLTAAQIDDFVAAFRGRGLDGMRGVPRADSLAIMAGEFGFLPSRAGGDVRLAARFRSISGGPEGAD